MRILFLALLLTACAAEAPAPRAGCSIDAAFDCSDLFADGTGKYYFKLTNAAGIAVSDLSVQVNSAQCTVTQPTLSKTSLEDGESITVPFSCSQTTGFSGDLFIQYRIVSPYAGEPIRPTQGTIQYENA